MENSNLKQFYPNYWIRGFTDAFTDCVKERKFIQDSLIAIAFGDKN